MSFKVVDKTAVVSYPDSPSSSYTAAAVRKALSHHLSDFRICNTVTEAAREFSEATGEKPVPALQVSDYDEIDWDGLKELEDQVLVNAYPIRKALIRKNALHSTFHHHTSKHPSCTLLSSVPQTFSFDLAFPDELDELFADDLYELGQALDSDEGGWWILKPAMAERGQGIRIFRTREELEAIFEEFEVSSDDEEEDDEGGAPTAVSMSQLRQWIIQRYIANPLLIDPQGAGEPSGRRSRKHHLRVYVLVVGALEVYVFTDVLALFAATPYSLPSTSSSGGGEDESVLDLTAHLTNTCLQTAFQSPGESDANVHLLSDLVSRPILSEPPPSSSSSPDPSDPVFTAEMRFLILDRISDVTAELFRAASEQPVHFQPLPNAFEIFGLDFLVDSDLGVWLLEVNACPDFAQTGDRLSGVIDRLFDGATRIAIRPFYNSEYASAEKGTWTSGEERHGFRKCLDLDMRRGRQ